MNRQLVVFYLKRHMLGIVGLVLAIGFGAVGFIMMGKAKEAENQAQVEYQNQVDTRAGLEKGQVMGGILIKNEDKNVDAENEAAEIHRSFITNAAKVIQQNEIAPLNSEEYMVHMANVIEEMNQRAREAFVQVPLDLTNKSMRIRYNFTFMNLRAVPQLAKDKIPELQLQLNDIKAIAGVLFVSRVRSIESLQRTRVTHEDLMAGASRDFLDARLKYTNNISVVRPYKVRFQCFSGGIAKTLNGFASDEKNYFVIRKMEVTQLGANAPAAAGGVGDSEGMGGFPGAGGSSSAGFEAVAAIAKPKKVLTPQMMVWLVRQGLATTKATNVISESVLEVELDLDVIRKKPPEQDWDEEVKPVPTTTPKPLLPPATNAPAASTNNAIPVNPTTDAPSAP